MNSRKRHMMDGMELSTQEKKKERPVKRKLAPTWKYWKQTPSYK